VGPEVAAAAERYFGGNTGGIMRPDGSGRWLFDLPAANRRVIRESGVPDSQIAGSGLSTASRAAGGPGMNVQGMKAQGPELFFSDRAARPCGRIAAVARLRPREDA
jgi:copper oxidase (laccase) domain-containing protein